MKKEKEIVPVYSFVEEEGQNELTPIKRKIAKTMEVTETFTVFDAMQYLAKMKKAVEDKKAEISGLETMIEGYEKELKLIERATGVQRLEVEFQKEVAEENERKSKEVEAALKEELLKTGNFTEKE